MVTETGILLGGPADGTVVRVDRAAGGFSAHGTAYTRARIFVDSHHSDSVLKRRRLPIFTPTGEPWSVERIIEHLMKRYPQPAAPAPEATAWPDLFGEVKS